MSKAPIIIVAIIIVIIALLPVLAKLKNNTGSSDNDIIAASDLPDDGTPAVISMSPENNATDVDPNSTKLVVKFHVPMEQGFSWTGGGSNFPETSGKPYWSSDMKTCTLPVILNPNWSYQLGLNSPSHKNFRSPQGIPLKPVIWRFSTGG